ncbi:MAG: flavodoxin family protein [Candidatus Methanoplasma sp.]|jgi:multimeric flavodoxin WrbA|nr:flavodoxin family protein [Candidatus Methanoplasma sp.]
MKALIICGSRKDGFTAEMCRSFSEGLRIHGISSEIFFPIDMHIHHCTGCGLCSGDAGCGIPDDMDLIFNAFGESGLVILATPIRFSGPSSAIKTVIDRFQPVWFGKAGHPHYAAALLVGGSPDPCFANTISIFKAFSATAGMKWLGHLEVQDADVKKVSDVSLPSFDYGNDLGSLLTGNRI